MDQLSRFLSVIRNKYVLSLLIFGGWMLFFDHNDLFLQRQRVAEKRSLEDSKAFYQLQIDETRAELAQIGHDPASLEKLARERYLMKRENEELYIIPEKQD